MIISLFFSSDFVNCVFYQLSAELFFLMFSYYQFPHALFILLHFSWFLFSLGLEFLGDFLPSFFSLPLSLQCTLITQYFSFCTQHSLLEINNSSFKVSLSFSYFQRTFAQFSIWHYFLTDPLFLTIALCRFKTLFEFWTFILQNIWFVP